MMTVHIERLRPGDDLRRSLEAWAKRQDLGAAFVLSAVGSLSPAMLRLAGRDCPTVIDGDSELLTLSGTISAQGVHLHMSVADADGNVTGGHLLAGSIVLTFFVYVFVNMGMVAGLLPVVGVPLPMVSYGGTSVITLSIGFGILMAIRSETGRRG